MSLQFSATTVSGTINRTAGLVGDVDPVTLLACVRLDTDTNAQINIVDIRRYGGAGNTGHHLGTTSTGTSLRGYGNYATNQTATVQELAVGTWTWIALRQTGTTLKASSVDHGGGSVTTQSVTLTAAAGTYDFIPTKMFIGSGDGGQYARATICHVREWSVELSDAEILDEIESSIPVKSTGLVAASSFAGGSLSVALNGQATGDTNEVWTASGDVVYTSDAPSFAETQAVTLSGQVSYSEMIPSIDITGVTYTSDKATNISETFTAYTASTIIEVTLSQNEVEIYSMTATLGSGTWDAAFTIIAYGTYDIAATISDSMGEDIASGQTAVISFISSGGPVAIIARCISL
jgi:hypothetical protein